jgi:hypothetical protein
MSTYHGTAYVETEAILHAQAAVAGDSAAAGLLLSLLNDMLPGERRQLAAAAELLRNHAAGADATTTAPSTPEQRLNEIAQLLQPCLPPNIFGGEDLCTCGSGQTFPCHKTKAAWLAGGLDVQAETQRVIDSMRPDDLGGPPWD